MHLSYAETELLATIERVEVMAIQLLTSAVLARINMLEKLIGSIWVCDVVSLTRLYNLLDDANSQLNELRGLE